MVAVNKEPRGKKSVENKKRNPRGRPSLYSEELAAAICVEVASGKSLRTIEQIQGMPTCRTIMAWLSKKVEFAQQYARAKQEAADVLAEDILDIADEIPPKDQFGKMDSAFVQWQKNRIDARKWTAGKLKPKKYGDRMTLGGEVTHKYADFTEEQLREKLVQLESQSD